MSDAVKRIALHLKLDNFNKAFLLAEELFEELFPTIDDRWKKKAEIHHRKKNRPLQKRHPILLPVVVENERTGAVLEFRLMDAMHGAKRNKKNGETDSRFDGAIKDAINSVWGILCKNAPDPAIVLKTRFNPRISLGEDLRESFIGSSVGLSAALEVFKTITGMEPVCHVIATGTVTPGGELTPAEDLALKLNAAKREGWGNIDSIFLSACEDPSAGIKDFCEGKYPTCRMVSTLEEALTIVFGPNAAEASVPPDYLSGHTLVKEVEELIKQRDFDQAMDQAEKGLACNFRGDVPLKLRWYIARAALHTGDPDTRKKYDECFQLAEDMAKTGRFENKKYKLFLVEQTMSEIDQFGIEGAIEILENINSDPSLDIVVKIDVQGALAQALAMSGRHDEAVKLRRSNKQIQEEEGYEGMAATIGRTCCCLAWEEYLAGNEERARQALAEAQRAIKFHQAETSQPLFNLYTEARIKLWSGNPLSAKSLINQAVSQSVLPDSDIYPVCMIKLVNAAASIESGQYAEGLKILEKLRESCIQENGDIAKSIVSWLIHLGLGWEIYAHLQRDEIELAEKKTSLAIHSLGNTSWNEKTAIFPPAARFFTSTFGSLGTTPDSAAQRIREWYASSWY